VRARRPQPRELERQPRPPFEARHPVTAFLNGRTLKTEAVPGEHSPEFVRAQSVDAYSGDDNCVEAKAWCPT
jgi:hypothetical protein